MIYRHWKDEDGPACLNVEVAAMARGLERSLPPEQVRQVLEQACGIPMPGETAQEIFDRGFDPETVKLEVERVRAAVGDTPLWPILQLADEKLAESERAALEGGADGVAFFAWNEQGADWLKRLAPMEE